MWGSCSKDSGIVNLRTAFKQSHWYFVQGFVTTGQCELLVWGLWQRQQHEAKHHNTLYNVQIILLVVNM